MVVLINKAFGLALVTLAFALNGGASTIAVMTNVSD